jgi:2-polyprenyl-3-methyl-5-hydroxy-6-metoxy-1,4-benzoquinol methylase
MDQDARSQTTTKTDYRGSQDRFGYEWDIYSEILPAYEEQFRRWTPLLAPQDWAGKTFLDVGCGMGAQQLLADDLWRSRGRSRGRSHRS